MPKFITKNILPETELRKKRISLITLLKYMTQNPFACQRYIIIIIITIVVVSLFRNIPIHFA
jgi:hypothetical protein